MSPVSSSPWPAAGLRQRAGRGHHRSGSPRVRQGTGSAGSFVPLHRRTLGLDLPPVGGGSGSSVRVRRFVSHGWNSFVRFAAHHRSGSPRRRQRSRRLGSFVPLRRRGRPGSLCHRSGRTGSGSTRECAGSFRTGGIRSCDSRRTIARVRLAGGAERGGRRFVRAVAPARPLGPPLPPAAGRLGFERAVEQFVREICWAGALGFGACAREIVRAKTRSARRAPGDQNGASVGFARVAAGDLA